MCVCGAVCHLSNFIIPLIYFGALNSDSHSFYPSLVFRLFSVHFGCPSFFSVVLFDKIFHNLRFQCERAEKTNIEKKKKQKKNLYIIKSFRNISISRIVEVLASQEHSALCIQIRHSSVHAHSLILILLCSFSVFRPFARYVVPTPSLFSSIAHAFSFLFSVVRKKVWTKGTKKKT